MDCIKCKKQIPDDAVFCQYCGKKQVKKSDNHNTRNRGNGEGSVYKTPNGTYACQITKYIGGNKAKVLRKYGFKTKKEALAYLPQLQIDKIKKSNSITILEIYKAIEPKLSKLSEKRQKIYEKAYERIKNIEAVDINSFELRDLQNVIDDVEGGYYAKRYVKDLLSKIYEYAYADGKIERNLVPYIELPQKEVKEEKTIFYNEEITKLWTIWDNEDYFSGYIIVLIYCGMRTGELWNIPCKTINFEKQIMFGGIKNNKGKYAPIFIPDEIIPIIKHFVENNNGYLYNDSPVSFYRSWRKFKEKYNFRDELQPYSGRHTCATKTSIAGLPEATIMAITRHTKYDTTLQYTHIDTENVLSKLNSSFNDVIRAKSEDKSEK